MAPLDRVRKNKCCEICKIEGNSRLFHRLFSLGVCIGNRAEVVQNLRPFPILLRIEDSLVALGRKLAKEIIVEEK
ncbi:MAG: ferrous iron transport protein A [Puniceicoccales bacterium]|jgi:Fe2+ transport system protein FeoA|nr:ferrous iron transport protein A [Puniceicoccales bacterium]